jgi:Protein of unknown function (DUF3574)
MMFRSSKLQRLQRRSGYGWRAVVPALLLAVASAGAFSQEVACPFPDQKPMLVIQMFFGRSVPHRHPVTAAEWNDFLKQTVTPLFPGGFTVYDAYGQWLSPQSHAVSRDPTKVMVIATADSSEVRAKVAEISAKYRQRFHQESVGVISLTECGAF